MSRSVYDFELASIDGHNKISFKSFKGKLILVINTASFCGFTKQYIEIEKLWQKYKDLGVIIIAVPSNDFGGQEPAPNDEIARFCLNNFNIAFILAAKTTVKGKNAHPFFKWVRENYGWLASPKWNFYKFLIDLNGEPLAWFSSLTSPTSKKITDIIDKNLPKAN